jgi:hypothetical protein
MGEREELQVVEPFMPVMSMALNSEHLHRITREQLAIAIDLIERLRAPPQGAPVPAVSAEDIQSLERLNDMMGFGRTYEAVSRVLAALRAPEAADAGAVAWPWRFADRSDWNPGRVPEWASGVAEERPLYASPTDAGMRERALQQAGLALDEIIQRTVNPAPTNMSDRRVLDWVNGKARAAHHTVNATLTLPSTDGKGGA